uniref:uncharacterized protein LOC105352788 n=1 Tax=Fragaria vesca subsp. vesca TaxID=101020 RepID=UPI0005CA0569|nr:PREDICTED: uncharacterized protein LOC105352788 [Fragaria vesca subsp. vesca]
MYMDMCLNEEQPEELDEDSTAADRKYYNDWWRANRMAKNVIRGTISDTIRSCMVELELAIDFMDAIRQKFKECSKAEGARLSRKLHELKFNGTGNIRTHLMQLEEINNKLRDLQMGVNDAQVVHIALESLLAEYGNLKSNYNSQKEKWEIDELISICVNEQDRILKDQKEKAPATSVNLVGKYKGKRDITLRPKKNKFKKDGKKACLPAAATENLQKVKCFFCKKVGHIKKNCDGFKRWMVKKGFAKQEGTSKA